MLDLKGYGPSIAEGALLTIEVGLLSLLIAMLLGMVAALGKLSKSKVAQTVAAIYTTIIRGIPDLVLMLLIFYGGQELINYIGGRLEWDYIDINPFIAGTITIGFIFGAYMTETFRGAILAVPPGQMEAGRAYGMSGGQVFRRILLPQMIRHAIPAFGNNWLVLLKTTALVSIIGLDDMVRKANLAAGATKLPFTFYCIVALWFLAFTTVSILLLRWAEKRYSVGVRRA
jgi:arginine/ornithine transport system permease protein